MRIDNEPKLDFQNVVIRPKRSGLLSRSEVELQRQFKFPYSDATWEGVPIIASNMDTVGTFKMAAALARHGLATSLHKFYSLEECTEFVSGSRKDPAERIEGGARNPWMSGMQCFFLSGSAKSSSTNLTRS